VGAGTELRLAADRGWNDVVSVPDDDVFASLRRDPRFEAVLFELAGRYIEDLRRAGASSQPMLLGLARAHEIRGERAEERALLGRAIATGGPMTGFARQLLAQLEQEDAARGAPRNNGSTPPP
jgi:hypothetical protein